MSPRGAAPRPGGEVVGSEGQSGGSRFGDYILLDRVGSGGSGAVHRAWQLSLERLVAIKLIDAGAHDAERFTREGRMAARLSHPHIVPIYEVGAHEGRRYLAMKLILGRSMSRMSLPPRRAVALMRQATSAIEYAHTHGVVHRDLKPHNLILEGDDHVWVTDFGIARSMKGGSTLTATGSVVGTPAYMPPEQARGERCDERSDVYSLGATLYELLTGRPPFDDGTMDLLVVMARVLSNDPVPVRKLNPKIPMDLETIVGKAMAKAPSQRYQSAAELGEDLRRFSEHQPILARPPGVFRQAAKWSRRRPVASSAIGFVLALAAGILLHTWQLKRQLAENTVAEANALGAAGRWEAARLRYNDANRAFRRLGTHSVAPDLGLLEAYHQAPPPLLVLEGHGAIVRAVAFLPDGKRVLSAGDDGSLRLWDVQLGRQIRSFAGHRGPVISLALSAAGDRAISGGRDQTLRVWNVTLGTGVQVLHPRGGAVLKVALAPDGRRALSRTEGGTVQLWDLDRGVELRGFEVAARRLIAVAFSPDGRLAFTGRNIDEEASVTSGRASLWEVASGREVQSFGGFGSEVESVTFSPDGRRALTAGYDRNVSVWDLASGQRLFALRGHRHGLTAAAYSPKDRMIVSGGWDNSVNLWDANDGKLVRSFDTGGSVEALALSPDGNFILTGGGDTTLKLWDLTVGQEARSFSGHESAVHAVALSPDGLLALSGGSDRQVRVWDVATGREIRSFPQSATAQAVAISPDGRTAIAVGSEASLRAWDLFTGAARPVYRGHTGAIRALAIAPDGKTVLTGTAAGEIVLWEMASGQQLQAWKAGDEVRSAAFSADGRTAVAASFDGEVRLLDLPSGRILRRFKAPEPERIGAVDFSRDGELIASGNDNKLVRLWNAHTGGLLRVLEGHLGDVRALSFSPGGDLLLSASRDRTLRAWDPATGRELHAFGSTSEAIRSLALSHDGRLALAGCEDGSLKLWDFTQVRTHRQFEERLARARQVMRQSPDDPEALATFGEWYAFRGVSGWAVDLLRRAERGGARVSPLMLGRAYWRQGDFQAARRQLHQAMEENEAPSAYLLLLTEVIGSADQVGRLAELHRHDGRVRFPFLGVRVRDDHEAGTGLGLGDGLQHGPVITRVFPGSPAQRAGLRTGDILIRADDQPVDSDSRLGGYLASRSAGAQVTLVFGRGGAQHSTSATLVDRPSQLWDPDGTEVREPRSGFTLQTLTPALAIALGLDRDTQGALVTNAGTLPPGGITANIHAGDVVTKVGGRLVASAEQTVAAMTALPLQYWNSVEVIHPGPAR
jgi:WD40 repeat protein